MSGLCLVSISVVCHHVFECVHPIVVGENGSNLSIYIMFRVDSEYVIELQYMSDFRFNRGVHTFKWVSLIHVQYLREDDYRLFVLFVL